MDTHIEKKVSQCEICQQQSTSSPARAYTNWSVAERPWQRIHLDFAGPFHNATWLICIDAFSKYPFVTKMASITAKATIDALKVIFSVEGLPDTIVTDNGRQFSAAEFQVFCNSNGITHLTTAPFHPASNGEAERFVRTFKTCPIGSSNKSPAELLHGRQPKTRLNMLVPTPTQGFDKRLRQELCTGSTVDSWCNSKQSWQYDVSHPSQVYVCKLQTTSLILRFPLSRVLT
ncbi:uncharacterized protein K02A2.6-like [Rhagoletis pomonella]|uniref:uncharacterized protein K02A2.6-like n=1 Tax=Rhagoletis pomonella TaxID=28610 RepID=UPI0017855CBA|nr:uncharacterized protein K02A2.6-like [Rhagoletis pomonella]